MAFDAFLYFPGSKVKGETLDATYDKLNAFQLFQFEFGVESTTNIGSDSGGGGAGKATFKDFTIQKKTDTASNSLFYACVTGNHFDDAVMELRRAGGGTTNASRVFLKISFKMVIVKDMTWSGAEGQEVLEESLILEYGAIKIEYFYQGTDGKMKKPPSGAQAEWSQKLNDEIFSVGK